MKLYKKILLAIFMPIIILVALLMILVSSTFGNYISSVYDIMLNFVLFPVYIVLSLIVIGFSKEVLPVKKLYLLFLVPFIFMFVSYLHGKNLHKDVIVEAKIEGYADWSSMVIFDNGTFDFKLNHPHATQHIKGTYTKNGNIYTFQESDDDIKYLKSDNYLLVDDEKMLIFKGKP